jgi:CHAT domain-containing protein
MDPDTAAVILEAVAQARTAAELDQVVAAYPELLAGDTVDALAAAGLPGGDRAAHALLDVVVRRLRICRDRGAPAAVAEVPLLIGGLPDVIPDAMRRAYVDFAAYEQGDDPDGLDRALRAWQEAPQQPGWASLDPRVRRMVQGDGGAVLLARYARSGGAADLDAAIGLYEELLAGTGGNDTEEVRARWMHGLSTALLDRYQAAGADADRQRATDLAMAAAEKAADRNLAATQYGLARALLANPDPAAADRSVEAGRAAVRAAAADDPQRSSYANSLGQSLLQRYERTGALVDLDESVAVLTQAYAGASPGTPWYPSLCNNRGNALLTRYERTGDPAHLDEAVDALQAAVDATGTDDVRRVAHLSNLAGALESRYQLRRDIPDLLAAHEAATAAVSGAAAGPERSDYLLNLASIMLAIDDLVPGQSTSVDEAITALEEAVDLTGEQSPRRPATLKALGDALVRRYDETGDQQSAAVALLAYRDACDLGLEVRPEAALAAARAWAGWALRREAWDEAITAGRQGLAAARMLHRRQLLREHGASFRRDVGDLHSRLALALAMTGAGAYPDSLLVLEEGRAVLMSDALERDRADLAELAGAGHADLLERYRAVTAEIAALDEPPPDLVRRLRERLDATLDEIRAVPGYADLLGEPEPADVFTPADPPLVYVFGTAIGGAAYVVTNTPRWGVHGLGLPELSEGAVRGWLERYFGAYDARHADPYAWERTLDEVTGELWEAGIGLIVETLRTAFGADRAVLIPVGLLSLLPLHAGWTGQGTARRYALDEVGFTYAPNARVLAAARDRAARATGGRLLVVGAPGSGSRQLSDVDAEVAMVRGHFGEIRQSADRAGVLAALPDAAVLHVAAHGYADIADPLNSALELAGGETLTLRDVFGLKLAGGLRLAVLSACETGIVSASVPDEAVGLAAGLLQAGAAGVVATLWAVPDRTAAVLMTLFYRAWRDGGRDPADALRAAQQRLRDATNDELSTEIPGYAAHRPEGAAAGRFWGRARPFAAARHWAAFSYAGA